MQLLNSLYSTLFLLLALPSIPVSAARKPPSKNAILLSQVKTLTLRSNAQTSHRRVSAIPQLTCKGPGCKHYKVDVLRCINQGSSYGTEDIEWSCTASLPEEFKLGSTDVICEGYSSPDDEYILKGSCGVEYRLLLTDKGEEKYGHGNQDFNWGSDEKSGWTLGSTIFVFIFVGVLLWICYSAYQVAPTLPRPERRQGGFWGGGWGGGGPGGGGGGFPPYDPPPPYSRKSYGTGGEGWRPGFWSGTAAGAAAGYMAGSRGNRQQEPVIPQRGSWFGGGGNNVDSPPRRSDSGSSSSVRHESTGFGSTSRR